MTDLPPEQPPEEQPTPLPTETPTESPQTPPRASFFHRAKARFKTKYEDWFKPQWKKLAEQAKRPELPSWAEVKVKLARQAQAARTWDRQKLQNAIQSFDPQKTIEWLTKRLQNRGTNFYGVIITIVLSTYFMADLTALVLGQLIPDPPPVRSSHTGGRGGAKQLENYSAIASRNLFNSRGLIPGEDGGPTTQSDPTGMAVKSALPLNLVGTLILHDENRSVATIEDKSASMVYPMQVNDEIPNKIKITKVEARRATFVNKGNNRNEYIELPEEKTGLQNPIITTGRAAPSVGGGIEKVAPTQFNVSRSEVDKSLADFNNILTQARAVPNFENGVAAGYKFFQVVPGSIFDKLGIQNGDVITGLNGTPINDPAKAFEMITELKTSNHLELQMKKDGKPVTNSYDIH